MFKINTKLKREDLILSEKPAISPSAVVTDCMVGAYTEIAADVWMIESSLDNYSYAMERSNIAYTDVGKFVNIASEVRINPVNHPVDWVSQHHFLYRTRQYGLKDFNNEDVFHWRKMQRVTIGNDVWIGHGAIILPGLTVGNGAAIAAGSVVTKDVAPYSIVAGNPAKTLRNRFPQSIWTELEAISWWDWDHDTLKERVDDFYDLRRFLRLYGKK